MGKTIEIRLSDAQHAALTAAHQAAGGTFFEFCRAKLMEGLPTPEQRANRRSVPVEAYRKTYLATQPEATPPADDRIARIEDAVARLTEYVLNGQPAAEPQHETNEPIDIDSLVDRQFAEAEAQGLTEHMPDEAEVQMAQSGVRPIQRRPIPFSAATAPKHLRQL